VRYSLIVIAALLFAAGVASFGYADALAFYTPPAVSAPLMSKAPNIDGLLEPGEWASAGAMSRFISLSGRSEPSAQTEMWVGYDAHSLYIGAILHDPEPAEIKAEATERDGPVYRDDCLELFFDPTNQGEKYIHFIINSLGTRYDALSHDEAIDYRWEVQVAMLESGWSVEMALPFEGDIPPSPASVWGFVAARNVPHLGEKSCSSRLLKSFHEAENFGRIIFAQTPAVMKLASLGDGTLGDNTAAVAVTNLASEAITAKVNWRVMAPTKHGNAYGAEKISVEPGKTDMVQVPYKISQDGLNTVQFSLTDAQGATVSRTPPYPLALPATGAELTELEKALAAALRVWSVLDDSDYKTQAGQKLDTLLQQWRQLAAQYRENRKTMSSAELMVMQAEIADLTARAELLKTELDAHMQTQAKAGFSVYPASALAEIDLSGGSREFALAYLEAARNCRAGLQMVIVPFLSRHTAT